MDNIPDVNFPSKAQKFPTIQIKTDGKHTCLILDGHLVDGCTNLKFKHAYGAKATITATIEAEGVCVTPIKETSVAATTDASDD